MSYEKGGEEYKSYLFFLSSSALYFILYISTFVLEVFKDALKIAEVKSLLKMHEKYEPILCIL